MICDWCGEAATTLPWQRVDPWGRVVERAELCVDCADATAQREADPGGETARDTAGRLVDQQAEAMRLK